MSRGWIGIVIAIVVGLLALFAWLLQTETDSEDPQPAAIASPSPGAATADVSPRPPALPTPRDASQPDTHPLAVEPAPAPVEPEPDGYVQLPVAVVAPDGSPLAPRLTETPRLGELNVIATDLPPAMTRLPDSFAPFYSTFGLGEFLPASDSRLGPGVIGELWLPKRTDASVSLTLGPEILVTQPLRKSDKNIVFTLGVEELQLVGGGLDLQIVDFETREPIAGASIQVGPSVGNFARTRQRGAETDQHGEVHLSGLPPGPTQLSIESGTVESRLLDITIPRGSRLKLGVVELHRAITLQGRVVSERGNPVAGAVLSVFPDEPTLASAGLGWPLMRAESLSSGDFAITRLGPRRYSLVASQQFSDGRWAAGALVPLDLTSGEGRDLTITVAPVASVTLVNPADGPALRVHVRNEAAPLFDWWPAANLLHSPQEWKLFLVPGRYVIDFGAPGQPPQHRKLDVGTEPLTVDLGN